jgi:hypothetical protein
MHSSKALQNVKNSYWKTLECKTLATWVSKSSGILAGHRSFLAINGLVASG